MRKDNNNDEIVFKTECKNTHLKKEIDSSTLESNCDVDTQDLLFDNLITVEELAVIFRLAPQTIRNWVAQGKLPYIKLGKRHWFLSGSVQEWLNRKEQSQWQITKRKYRTKKTTKNQ